MKQYTADNLNKYFTFDDKVKPDAESLTKLIATANLSGQDRESITQDATRLVEQIRSTKSPSLMEHFTLLLQSPTAADVIPTDNFYSDVISRDNVNSGPASEWRQNHNFREEAFTKLLYRELRDEVDGIIPVFEWTLARNWIYQTKDGVHISGSYYEEIFHLQVSAIISAIRSSGRKVPLISQDDMHSLGLIGLPLG